MQFDGVGGYVLDGSAGVQFCEAVVDDFPRSLAHELSKDAVGRREDFWAAAKVLLQGDGLTLLGIVAEAVQTIGEEGRLGEAESVYALLDVADDEEIVRPIRVGLAADQADDRLLQRVDVLKFIDEHMVELSVQRGGRRSKIAAGIGPAQQPVGKALHVREIERVDLSFGERVRVGEGPNELRDGLCMRRRVGQIR